MKKVIYTIEEDKYLDGYPTYYILKSVYWFGFHLYGQLMGVGGKFGEPFQDLETAQEFFNLIKNV